MVSQPVLSEATWPLSIASYLLGLNVLPKPDQIDFWVNSAGLSGRTLMTNPIYLAQLVR